VVVVAQLVAVAVVLGLLVLGTWWAWTVVRGAGTSPPRLPPGRRAELAAAIAAARWSPAHDEVDGATRILLRRSYTGLDGRPVTLEERVLETFPADDPAWEAAFTEAMARARFRCAYLNTEESEG
jgi:hypothetical protein